MRSILHGLIEQVMFWYEFGSVDEERISWKEQVDVGYEFGSVDEEHTSWSNRTGDVLV